MTKNTFKTNNREKILYIFNYAAVGLFNFLCIYPFYYITIYSISNPQLAQKGISFIPAGIDFNMYISLFKRNDILNAFFISASRTISGTVICVLCTSIFAYLVTKREMIGRKIIYRFVIITMYVNAGLIPWYLTMRAYGLKNSFLLYIIPGAVYAFYMILVKTYIEQLPASMEESASLDGAGFFKIFFEIIMPLSKPIIATVAVYCSVNQWNTWTDNFFLIQDTRLQTVQLILYNYLNSAKAVAESMKQNTAAGQLAQSVVTSESVQMTAIVVTVIPILLVYPFLQKYFTKGIMMGAVKG